jgi:hypothetical protein
MLSISHLRKVKSLHKFKIKSYEIERVVIDTHWDDFMPCEDSMWPLKIKL